MVNIKWVPSICNGNHWNLYCFFSRVCFKGHLSVINHQKECVLDISESRAFPSARTPNMLPGNSCQGHLDQCAIHLNLKWYQSAIQPKRVAKEGCHGDNFLALLCYLLHELDIEGLPVTKLVSVDTYSLSVFVCARRAEQSFLLYVH